MEFAKFSVNRWAPAAVGLSLLAKDRVRTGEASRAALKLTDLSVVRMDELTTMTVAAPRAGAAKGTLDVTGPVRLTPAPRP